ncbi:MAG TPA: hypothetical protein VK558_01130 [Patescibacteria group bacterium]|nr:hypothetical protein [Patescibacteria group bacterium]
MTSLRHRLKALLSPPLVILGALIVLLEEVLWAGLGRLMARLAHLPQVARVEAAIGRLPPYPAMALFLLPVAVIVPVKLGAVWLITQGRVGQGVLLILAAKLSGMAILARLYALCRPSLCRLNWFARLEAMLLRWNAWAHALMDELPLWRQTKTQVHAAVAAVKTALSGSPGWLARRMRAAIRLARAQVNR